MDAVSGRTTARESATHGVERPALAAGCGLAPEQFFFQRNGFTGLTDAGWRWVKIFGERLAFETDMRPDPLTGEVSVPLYALPISALTGRGPDSGAIILTDVGGASPFAVRICKGDLMAGEQTGFSSAGAFADLEQAEAAFLSISFATFVVAAADRTASPESLALMSLETKGRA
ncbi:MAG: hypothetical protein AAF250_16240 [Pseudomonadota bacterium]